MTATYANLTALHIDDTVTTCDCCGRQNLKATVLMRNSDTGAEFFFGRTCAARNSSKTHKQIRQEIFNEQARKEQRAAQLAHHLEAWNAYQSNDLGNICLRVQRRNYHQTGGQSVNGNFPEWLRSRATS